MAIGQADELLTVAEAAKVLKVSTITIHRWLKQGRLTAHRIGPRTIRISSLELTRLLSPRDETMAAPHPAGLQPVPGLEVVLPTEAEIARRRVAIAQAKELQAAMLKRRGGVPFDSSWEMIREAREERSSRI
ncbi:MAG TPA: helix-turn-helix domain-containing protein [Chloroflexota bacterium]|jgi:excisionase family DNA binding protein